MVIQCPGCSTKFSIETEELSQARNPTFHCSRCDHFFDLKGKRRSSRENTVRENTIREKAPGEKTEKFSASSPASAVIDYHIRGFEEKEMSDKEKQLSLLSEELISADESERWTSRSAFLHSGPLEAPTRDLLSDDDENLPLVTAEWPDSRTDREVEADLREVAKKTTPFANLARVEISRPEPVLQTNIAQVERSEPIVKTMALETAIKVGAANNTLKRELNLQKIAETSKSEIETLIDATATSRFEGTAQLLKGAVLQFPQSSPSKTPEAPKISIKETLGGLKARTGRFSKGGSQIGVALSAPLALTLLFWGLSSVNNPIVSGIVSIAGAEVARVAPEGLEVQSLVAEVRALNDGREVLEVKGKVVNSTPKSFKSPQLVVRGFDNRNQKLSEQILPSVNGIQHVESLTTIKSETLTSLQQEEGVMKILKPGESVPFRAALFVDGERPSYFDARVYSVTR